MPTASRWPGRASSQPAKAHGTKLSFAFYERLLDALAERGIKPHLTLYHWDLPQGLQDDGGWLKRETAHRFADYAGEVARRFGNRLAAIATHNEPWCTANLGYGNAQFAPGVADAKQAIQVSHHLLLSHGLAMTAMRAANTSARLGIVLNQWTADPATDSQADRDMAELEYAFGAVVHGPDLQGTLPRTGAARAWRQCTRGARRRLWRDLPADRFPGL
ncbi:family 1 glycosylhydrolase [Massilia sp. B-10]|nr:family 1 glycosylhydrolase [Massilia sp. B-10]